MARAEHSEICDAPPEACFDAIADLETYPSWQSAVKAVTVRERDVEGRPHVVEFRTDARVREVRYVLRYHYDRPARIWWDYVEGDAKHVSGQYVFEDLGGGRTRATHTLDVDAGGPLVPGRVKQSLADQAVSSSVRKLRERVAGAA